MAGHGVIPMACIYAIKRKVLCTMQMMNMNLPTFKDFFSFHDIITSIIKTLNDGNCGFCNIMIQYWKDQGYDVEIRITKIKED